MKIEVHPASVAVGVLLSAMAVLLLGMAPQYQQLQLEAALPGVRVAGTVGVHGIPKPQDIVNLSEGTPYTVPEGKILIITDWVTTDPEVSENNQDQIKFRPRILVNGVEKWGGGFFSKRSTIGSGGLSIECTGAELLAGTLRAGIRADSGDEVLLASNASHTGSVPFGGQPTTFAAGYITDAP